MRHSAFALLILLALAFALPASAQTTPTITVLGVGQVAFDVPGKTGAEAQAQVYRAYVPANSPTAIALTVTCTGAQAPATCTFPLSALTLTSAARNFALTATLSAADGEATTAKVASPFLLAQGGPPVAPTFGATPIRPPD